MSLLILKAYILGVILSYLVGIIDWLRTRQKMPAIWFFYGFLISLGSWVVFIWMLVLYIKERVSNRV
jgi:cell division septal protein FtsQ